MSFVSTDEEDCNNIHSALTNQVSSTTTQANKEVISSIILSESLKRKKSPISSPECNFDLTEEFDLIDDKVDTKDKENVATTSCVEKLQKFKYEAADDSKNKKESVLETSEDYQQSITPNPSIPANKRSRLSTGKKARRSGGGPGNILRYADHTQLEKENSEDRDLVQLMLKRRRESGITETPAQIDNLDLGSDFENGEDYLPSKSCPALTDVSNQLAGTKKPLFSEAPCNTITSSPTMIFSSGDEVWPEETRGIKPSLESADEIEEPEYICRKVRQPERRRVRRRGEGSKSSNKGRLSLSLAKMKTGSSSEDDFM
jgi:hypothetical protein